MYYMHKYLFYNDNYVLFVFKCLCTGGIQIHISYGQDGWPFLAGYQLRTRQCKRAIFPASKVGCLHFVIRCNGCFNVTVLMRSITFYYMICEVSPNFIDQRLLSILH